MAAVVVTIIDSTTRTNAPGIVGDVDPHVSLEFQSGGGKEGVTELTVEFCKKYVHKKGVKNLPTF